MGSPTKLNDPWADWELDRPVKARKTFPRALIPWRGPRLFSIFSVAQQFPPPSVL